MSTMTAIERAEAEFAKLLIHTHPMSSINFISSTIHRMIGNSEVSWDELSFTEADITERVRLAKVRTSRENFDKMLHVQYSQNSLEYLAATFRTQVESGETTWKELGFTDKDVTKRTQAKAS